MPWPAIARGLAAAGAAIVRAAKSPAVRRAAVRAATKTKEVFNRFTARAREVCPRIWRAIRGRSINISDKQLQAKFKHANDFGIGGNHNSANAARFRKAIEDHVADSGTKIIKGTYHKVPCTHYFNPKTGLNVMKDASGEFISGWKLQQAKIKHLLSTGKL